MTAAATATASSSQTSSSSASTSHDHTKGLPIVKTSTGAIRGFVDTHPVSDRSTYAQSKGTFKPVLKFLGVPYGRIERRWQQSEQVKPWAHVLDCFEFGPNPPTVPGFMDSFSDVPGYHARNHIPDDEKAMFTLNIFASEGVKRGDNVPCMLWIYGGSWKDGKTSSVLYDATTLVRHSRKPMICVSVNYRTNIFGFLASEDLRDPDNDLVGNYGLRDQLLAMKWVKRNIHEFGGNPDNITLFGESAGAASVGYHVGGIDPCFQKAIMQSGAASTMAYQSVEQHEKLWLKLLDFLHIAKDDPDRVAKARAVSTAQIQDFVARYPGIKYAACRERGIFSIWDKHPDTRIAAGEWIPSLESVMLGVTRDEGTMFAEFFGMTGSQQAVDGLVDAMGPASAKLRSIYSGLDKAVELAEQDPNLVSHPAARMLHDTIFEAPVAFAAHALRARRHADTGKECSVYLYRSETVVPQLVMPNWGYYHTTELPLVFNLSPLWENDVSREEHRWAESYGEAWRRFAASGRPALATDWPKFHGAGGSGKVKVFKESSQFLEDYDNHEGIRLMDQVIRGRWGIKAKQVRPKI
ncbi:hypothetical protein PYCC9005_003127 [Savitreella phatthalungensis]